MTFVFKVKAGPTKKKKLRTWIGKKTEKTFGWERQFAIFFIARRWSKNRKVNVR